MRTEIDQQIAEAEKLLGVEFQHEIKVLPIIVLRTWSNGFFCEARLRRSAIVRYTFTVEEKP